jgi:hypothetical protein
MIRANENFIIFVFTPSWLEPTIYHIQGQHANNYNTDADWSQVYISSVCFNDHMYIVMIIKKNIPRQNSFNSTGVIIGIPSSHLYIQSFI